MTLKVQSIKGKINELDFIKIKNFYFVKDPTKRMKKNKKQKTTDWEKILANHKSNKIMIYIEHIKNTHNSIVKKQAIQLENGQKT